MRVQLIDYSDSKIANQNLTLGKDYEVEEFLANGYRFIDDGGNPVVMVKSKFKEDQNEL